MLKCDIHVFYSLDAYLHISFFANLILMKAKLQTRNHSGAFKLMAPPLPGAVELFVANSWQLNPSPL
jgi:hypothetical protein